MRLLYTLVLGLALICGEVYLGMKTFYPQLHTAQFDIVDDLIEEKKTIIDQIAQADLAWIVATPVILVGTDPNFYPLETFNERGQYTGIGGDYLRLLSHLTGINFQVMRQDDWAAVEELAQQKQVHMFMAMVETDRRNQFMQFTDPYINLPGMIVVKRGDDKSNLTVADLEGKKVAVVQNYFWHDYLLDNYPSLELVEAKNTSMGLQMVAEGTADAIVDYEFNLLEKMQLGGLYQLESVGEVKSDKGHAIAIRKDLPELSNAIKLALASITDADRRSLADKWLNRAKPAGIERRLQWYFFFFTQAILLCLGIVIWAKSSADDAVRAKVKTLKKSCA